VAVLLPLGESHDESHGRAYHSFSVLGSKRKLKAGVWELRGELGVDPITGKRKQFSETFHGPARAADQRLRDLIDQQAPSRSDGVGVTVGQLLD
jgi:hypothetical protein